jgi:light-harvesting protein B-800-850 alpha chain
MNQGKMWRVVSPSVGVPLFLAAVAVTSLIVHGSLVVKTDWVGKFFNGNQKAVATATAPAAATTTTAAAPTK